MKYGRSRITLATGQRVALMFVILLAAGSSALAQNSTIFGPNVYVFTPSDSVSSINSTLSTLAGYTQFDTGRAAVLFEPGTYTGVQAQVGFYESVAGLGTSPTAVNINQGFLAVNTTDANGNLTTNFWRSIENMSMVVPTADQSTLQWGVSQGSSFRRINVTGGVELANTDCGEASGGFIGDSEISGVLNACSQQQWYTRNSSLGSFTGYVWNYVFSGVTGAPAQSSPFSNDAENVQDTVLATTPVVREKPYLYMDSSGNYWVFSPSLQSNSTGADWSNGGLGAGTSLPISSFYIATPSSTVAAINAALASGKNLILTPGIYQYGGPINVTNANTVVLGLGYADLVPQAGTAALTVADVDGVQLGGFLIDAGPTNSPVLLQIGVNGAPRVSHASDPTSISDVSFRIGGATAGTATTSMEVDSDNVILDNIWAWRADHGTDAAWTGNVALHGLVVNGDSVTALGLAVEHYQAEQVLWNGENGETVFYQSEMPYDVPSQAAWMDGSVDGYASYNVASGVTSHTAYGVGVYSYFDQGVNIIANSGIAAPVVAGVAFTDPFTVFLNGSGQITNTIASNNSTVDNAGATVNTGNAISDVGTWGSASGGGTSNNSGSGSGGSTTYTYGVTDNSTSLVVNFTGTPTVQSAIVSYVLNGGGQNNVTMTNSGGNFSYTIPGVTAGAAESLSYYFTYDQSDGTQFGPTTTYSWNRGSGTGGGTGTGNCSGVSNITVGATTYTPQWCQEFNGAAGSPDTTAWNFDLGNNSGWGNNEVEVYCGPAGYPNNPAQCPTTFSASTAPVYIDGIGHLVIQPINVNGTWLSGRMNTENLQNFQYGVIEASIQVPDTSGQGLWPAFWSLGSNIGTVGWPTSGEADFMEDWSTQVDNGQGPAGFQSTIHTADTGGAGIGQAYDFSGGQATDTAYHTYGIVWSANEMQFFVDNAATPFFTVTPSSLPSGDTWPFNADIFMLLNVAVGGTLGGSTSGLTNPQPMMVDYVRYYAPQ